ncbi:two-component system response regulator YesN [Paenibacillus sp. DS2015]|uniref:response regulator transcription factor n=1 Tax=Paenibacillus sp. DS2015 TaxID=3373917 RepID=UPI003D23BA9B
MFNVLIVDDEPAIREGLTTIIDWNSHGYRVIDTASNGREAIMKITQHRPDLTIIDMRMPGMTGLEVIEQVRKENSRAHFLILSGYADFDYAKKAIGYGVDAYLLKPVDEDEMIEELQRISMALTKERELKLRNAEEDHFFREHMVESFLFNENEKGNTDNINHLGLCWSSYQVVLVEVHGQLDGDSLYLNALKQKMTSYFDELDRGIVFSAGPHIGVLLKGVVNEVGVAEALFKELSAITEEWHWTLYAAAGNSVTNLLDIGVSYASAAELLHHRFLFEKKRLMISDDKQGMMHKYNNTKIVTQADEVELSDKLYYAVDIRSNDAVRRVLEEMEQQIVSFGNTEQVMKSSYAQIFSMAINKLSNSNSDIYPVLQEYSSFISDVYRQNTLTELRRMTFEYYNNLIDRLGGISKDTVVKQVIDFIQRNSNENLKLELLAEVFNYNSAYLGKLFKNYTGEYFNAFLDKVRIEKAKELLSQGLKIHQVASRVGYANVDYFHSKFKKYEGISPSSYRDIEKNSSHTSE